jgi:Ca-activated chloride channel family protein
VKAALPALRRAAILLFWTGAVALPSALVVRYVLAAHYGAELDPDAFRFERPDAAWLGLGVALALLARGFLQRRDLPRLRVSRGRDLAALSPGLRTRFADSTTGLRAVGLGLLVLALMGPQSIHARNDTEVEGIDIVLTLDLSLSMQAGDIRPNRFDATKQVVQEFIGRRPNDRIGAVVFGRDAYTLMPLTTDKESLRSVIQDLTLELIDGRGTAIGNAIGVSLNRLRRSSAKSRVMILLTDGESNAGNISPEQAAELASTMGVKVYTILMGRTDDAPVQRGVDLFGQPVYDRSSFPINPELLRSIAERTGGEHFSVGDREALERSFHTILDQLEKSEIEDAGKVYADLYPAFAWPALFLLVLEFLLHGLVLRRWP